MGGCRVGRSIPKCPEGNDSNVINVGKVVNDGKEGNAGTVKSL